MIPGPWTWAPTCLSRTSVTARPPWTGCATTCVRRATRVRRRLRQRPPRLAPPVAGRADRARRRGGSRGGDGPGHEHRAAGGAAPGRRRQDPQLAGGPDGMPRDRRPRPRVEPGATTTRSASRSRSGGRASTSRCRWSGRWCGVRRRADGTSTDPRARSAPVREPRRKVWFGSWGSDRRLGEHGRGADGWFAVGVQRDDLRSTLPPGPGSTGISGGRARPGARPGRVATAWALVTDERRRTQPGAARAARTVAGSRPETLATCPSGRRRSAPRQLAAYAEAEPA